MRDHVTVVSGNASSASRSTVEPPVASTTNTDSYAMPQGGARRVTGITLSPRPGAFGRARLTVTLPNAISGQLVGPRDDSGIVDRSARSR
jgi:hypothetical protein